MPHLRLQLLGSWQASLDEQPIGSFRSVKNQALLAYLAVEAGRSHPRAMLADLLWPEEPEARARLNLRQTIFQLRALLQPAPTTKPTSDAIPIPASSNDELLLITPQAVQWNREAGYTIDALQFGQLLDVCRAHHALSTTLAADQSQCLTCLAHLQQAVDLYRGEFLDGLFVENSPALEEWINWQRQHYEVQVLEALSILTVGHDQSGDYAVAQRYAQRQIQIDPLREEGQRQAMRLLALRGQTAEAVALYDRLRRLIRKELNAEPSIETVDLVKQIRRGAFKVKGASSKVAGLQGDKVTGDKGAGDKVTDLGNLPLTPAQEPPVTHPVTLSPLHPLTPSPPHPATWNEAPETGHIYGRQGEVAQLSRWLLAEHCQLVALLGMGGMGKTTLAATVAKQVEGPFAQILWRSMVNAPPLGELLRGVLQRLTGLDPSESLPTIPSTLDEQLALLLQHLRQQRCLLILDNVESLLESETSGKLRLGYEGYAQLLKVAAENKHNSCLLLTSRERPQGIMHWEEDFAWVRTLQVGGLDTSAGQTLLTARGVAGDRSDIQTLVKRYSGNPLALKLVAHTINDLFAGAIGNFLQEESPIFDDIRAVLDQQFARLTGLEQELLTWLAIEREPISSVALRQNLIQTYPTRHFVEALRSLQRRSLLEAIGDQFTLQNVVTEYLTDRLIAEVVAEISTEQGVGSVESDSALNRYALLKAQAKEYVRQSQERLIVQPIAEQLITRLGRHQVPHTFRTLLAHLRATAPHMPGYAAGNLINLLRMMRLELTGYDLSQLCVWQADLRGVAAAPLNLRDADLTGSAFTLNFTIYAVRFNELGQVLVAGASRGGICLWVAEGGQLQSSFRSPSNGAYPFAFSDDGRWLAAGALDHAVQLWSTETGVRLHTLVGHRQKIASIRIHSRSQLLASGSVDHAIRLWHLGSGALLRTLLGHGDEVGALAFHPDGNLLASGSNDHTIGLWNPDDGQHLGLLRGHEGGVTALAFSPDGRWLASGSNDCSVRLWEIATGQCFAILQGHSGRIRVLAFQPGGFLLASGSTDRTIRLWQYEMKEPQVAPPVSNSLICETTLADVLLGHTYEVASLAFSDDGRYLVSGGAERVVRLWESGSGQALGLLQGHATVLHSVRFSPDGAAIASGGADGIVRLWRSEQDDTVGESPVGAGFDTALFRVNQDRAVWKPAPTNSLAVSPFHLATNYEGHSAQIFAVAFSPDGSLLASGSADQTLRLWEVQTGRVAMLHGHSHYVTTVAFSPDGQWLVSGSADSTVRVWRVALVRSSAANRGSAGQPAAMLQLTYPDGIGYLAFSPDGETLVISSGNHLYVESFRQRLQALQQTNAGSNPEAAGSALCLQGHLGHINRLEISPDGSRIASIGTDYTVRLWRTQTGERLTTLSGIGSNVVAFDPSGRWLAYNIEEMVIVIADAQTLAVVQTLRGHTSTVISIHFSPAASDGSTYLVSCGWDGTICLWDVARGECLQTLRIPGPYVGLQLEGATGISEAQREALAALGASI